MGVIQILIIHDTPTGSKYYELTPLGKKIAENLIKMQEEYEKFLSSLPPKDPKEFLKFKEEG